MSASMKEIRVPAAMTAPVGPPPTRRRGSIRRTSNVDIEPADGLLALTGTARDLITTDSQATVVSESTLSAMLGADRTLTSLVTRGEFREMDVPLTKLAFANLNWDLAEYGLSVQGMRGSLATDEREAVDDGRWQDELLYAKAYTISGGSNEIMRNLLGERALGLPREPKPG